MKKTRKALLLSLCALLLVAASVMGTMAYLTSTDEVVNTFTVGKVAIKLDEAEVGLDGKVVAGSTQRVQENSYKLLPGHEYDKDPTVTVLAGSEDCYVRILVTATFDKTLNQALLATDLDNIFTGYSAAWVRHGEPVHTVVNDNGNDKSVITYEYRYRDKVLAVTENTALPALFTGIQVPGEWTNDTLAALGGVKIQLVANAIQADGFEETAEAAWTAFSLSQ